MRQTWSRISVASFVFVAIGVVFGCNLKPAPGKSCSKPGSAACMDAKDALLCADGKYVQIPCRGGKGCYGSAGSVYCDDDLAQEGDACMPTTNENHACSTDHKKMLVCKDGKFQMMRKCGGPQACQVKATLNEIDCDYSIADVGDPCLTGKVACSSDAKYALRCVGGVFANDNSCRGPKGCRPTGTGADCDESVAMEGDPCDKDMEVSCTMDGKAVLQCKQGKYTHSRDCKSAKGCWVQNLTLHCDY